MLNHICASSRKHQKTISKTTEVLSQKFGITYFGIQTITADGHWSLVTNNPAWVEHSVGEQFYLHDPTLIKPDYYQSGISFISSHHFSDFRNTLLKTAADQFDMDHCLAIVEKNNEHNEFAFFATSCSNKNILHTYISQFKLLQRFIRYFKYENRDAFQDAIDDSVDLKILKKHLYFEDKNIVACHPVACDSVLDNLIYKLSTREQQCLSLLLEGKSAKEIAKMLSLSYRTIEEYIVNLKHKTGCRRLHDLFALFNDRL